MKQKKEKKYKILVGFVSMIFLILCVVTIVSYFRTIQLFQEEINQGTSTKVQFFQDRVKNYFEQRELILTSEAFFVKEKLKSRESNDEIIERLEEQFSFLKYEYGIEDIYVGFPDGVLKSGMYTALHKQGMKAYERPWYRKSMEEKDKVVYTDIYKDFRTGFLVLTMSRYISDGENEAVVAIDLSLQQLLKLLEKERFGEGGYPFIIDSDGKFIIHPQYGFEESSDKANTIYNIVDGNFKETGMILLQNEMKLIKANYQGKDKLYMSQKIGNTDFYLIVSIDQRDMQYQLNAILLNNVLLLAIAALTYVLVLIWLRWKLGKRKAE